MKGRRRTGSGRPRQKAVAYRIPQSSPCTDGAASPFPSLSPRAAVAAWRPQAKAQSQPRRVEHTHRATAVSWPRRAVEHTAGQRQHRYHEGSGTHTQGRASLTAGRPSPGGGSVSSHTATHAQVEGTPTKIVFAVASHKISTPVVSHKVSTPALYQIVMYLTFIVFCARALPWPAGAGLRVP